MKQIKPGDVFLLNENDCYVYIQYIKKFEALSHLIRIVGYFDRELREDEITSLVAQKEIFNTFFVLQYAYKRSIVKRIDNFNIPSTYHIPKYTRTPHKINGERKWWIVEVETRKVVRKVTKLSDEEIQFSPYGISNDTLIINRCKEGFKLTEWL